VQSATRLVFILLTTFMFSWTWWTAPATPREEGEIPSLSPERRVTLEIAGQLCKPGPTIGFITGGKACGDGPSANDVLQVASQHDAEMSAPCHCRCLSPALRAR